MALFVRQDEERSQLQEKLAADLKDKLKSSQIKSGDVEPVMLEDDHQTRPAGMVIMILALIAVLAFVIMLFLR